MAVFPRCHVIRREVEVGGLTKSQLVRTLRQASIRLNRYAMKLFRDDRFTVSDTKHVVRTVELTVGDLGYVQGATSIEILVTAGRFGLDPCPLELAPYLRLAYLDQPEGSFGSPIRQHRAPLGSITVASKPLDADPATPKGFYLRRIDGALWLRGYLSDAAHVWSPKDHLVFSELGRSVETPGSDMRARG